MDFSIYTEDNPPNDMDKTAEKVIRQFLYLEKSN